MKVIDLIKMLKQYPQDIEAVVAGYEDGFDLVIGTKEIKLSKKIDSEEWEGELEYGDEANYLLLESTRKS